MFSTTLKQSLATLGVVAGLLAAAATAPSSEGAAFRGEMVGLEPTAQAPASPRSEVFTSVSN